MPHPDLSEARKLFERSERESDPSRKFSALEEALELVDLALDDSSISHADRDFALNLRRSHIRRLLAQLVGIRNIEFGDWWNYIHLLLIERSDEVETVIAGDATLKEGYQAFVGLWKDELLEALERVQRGL